MRPEASPDRPTSPEATTDFVEVRLPADSSYLSVLRTATAGLASRLDFTLDEIEDLRIAVDEACALLLTQALPDTELICRFDLEPAALRVTVAADTRDGSAPSRDSFGWLVLASLAGEVDASVNGEREVRISLRKERGTAQTGAE